MSNRGCPVEPADGCQDVQREGVLDERAVIALALFEPEQMVLL